MDTKVQREVERSKHNQDMIAVAKMAERRRRDEGRRSEQEREVNARHEAMIDANRKEGVRTCWED